MTDLDTLPDPDQCSCKDSICSEEEQEDEVYEEESDWDDENHSTIRAKWQMDGAKTLDECIEYLKCFIDYIEELKKQGWYLTEPVRDDWGHIKRDPARAATVASQND